jgi:hypothetical protein
VVRAEYANETYTQKIADEINIQFNRDFGSIHSKAHKLGLLKPRSSVVTSKSARLLVPRLAKLPRLTIALHFSTGTLLDRINTVVPRSLSLDHRDDVIGEMAWLFMRGGSTRQISSGAYASS